MLTFANITYATWCYSWPGSKPCTPIGWHFL